MEEEAGSAASLRTESAEIEGQIREIKKNKETVRQELADSEALEARIQKEIALSGQKLEEERRLEAEASGAVSEWEREVRSKESAGRGQRRRLIPSAVQ